MMEIAKLIESEIGDFFAGFGHPGEPETPEEMQSQLLARVRPLLAGLEREPVYQACKEAGVWVDVGPDEVFSLRANREQVRELYAAPQLPQPAVPDEMPEPDTARMFFTDAVVAIAKVQGWNACRAAMLQGAEPVSQRYTLRDGWVAVPVDMAPDMMRAVQLNSELGAYAAANLAGAYSLFREFWDVAVKSVPNQEVK